MPTTSTALTDALLRKLKPTGSRHEITDRTTTGLRVRISSTGAATFLLKSRDAANQLQTITLGSYPDMTLKAARDEANRLRLELKAGGNPNAIKRARRLPAEPQPNLRMLVKEFETVRGASRKVWAVKGPRSSLSEARRCIEGVFAKLMDREVSDLTEMDFAAALKAYRPVRATAGKTTSNGQASRARAYLMPVFHWAAGRKGFVQAGAGRSPRLEVLDLGDVFDPAIDDPTITGERDRVLTQDELHAVLPLLCYPAPKLPRLRLKPEMDFRPIALRFLLLTAGRLEEVVTMTWSEVDFGNKVWRKPSVKSTKGGPRSQSLPLSDAAIELLQSLPAYGRTAATTIVFPNETGGELGNWTRFQNALMEATKTAGWHRHDLRRTASTLMQSLNIPVSTIDQILGHTAPLRRENVSSSAMNYLRMTSILNNTENPQAKALNTLANILRLIEDGKVSSSMMVE